MTRPIIHYRKSSAEAADAWRAYKQAIVHDKARLVDFLAGWNAAKGNVISPEGFALQRNDGTRVGTNHFTSKLKAILYYQKQGLSPGDVMRKIKEGEIAIGMPPCSNQTVLFDEDGRYWIQRQAGE